MKKSSLLGYITGFGIGLATLVPGTLKDKASIDDVVANLQPQDSQEQVDENNYKPSSAIEYAKNVVAAKSAYAGGMDEIMEAKDRCSRETGQDNCIYVDDYYELAEPVNNPEMPEGLRVRPFNPKDSTNQNTVIKSSINKPLNFDETEFIDFYQSNQYGKYIKDILKKGDVTLSRFENLVHDIKDLKGVQIYDEGFMMLYDRYVHKGYIFPVGEQVAQNIYDL